MSKARELSKLPNYVLSTVAELKLAVGKEQGDKAFVGGYYADGDGGGGDFYWDAVSVEADNGGTIFQVTGTTTGRWKRIYSGSVSVKWFGVKGDGVTDDTVAIQNALDNSTITYIPTGVYIISSTLNVNCSLFGDGMSSSVFKATADIDAVSIEDSLDFSTFRNFGVYTEVSSTKSGIVLGNDTHNNQFENIYIVGFNYGLNKLDTSNVWMTYFVNVRVGDCAVGFRFDVTGAANHTTLSFKNCYVAGCSTGFYLWNVYDLSMEACGVDVGTQHGFYLGYIQGGNIVSSHFETFNFGADPDQSLIYLWNCNGLNIDGITSGNNTASLQYYIIKHNNGNKNIKLSNVYTASCTNQKFMYVGSLSTRANTNFIISGVSDDIVYYDGSGDFSATNLDYQNKVISIATDVNGKSTITFADYYHPAYLSASYIAFLDDGADTYNYVIKCERYSTSMYARLVNIADGAVVSTSGLLIKFLKVVSRQ
jgi:hypothetical protein